MKSLLNISIFGIFLLSTTLIGLAQPSPVGPKILISPPKGKVVWSVTYSYDKSHEEVLKSQSSGDSTVAVDPESVARPAKSSYVINGSLGYRSSRSEAGSKDENYYLDHYEYHMSPHSSEIKVGDTDSYPSVEQIFRQKFPGVHWVLPKFFVKLEDKEGEPCAYFRDGTPPKQDPNADMVDAVIDNSKYSIKEAWFSVKTGLPVAFKLGDQKGKFSFEAPETASITVPPAIRVKMAEMARIVANQKKRDLPEGAFVRPK